MYYRINIGHEGVFRLHNVSAHDQDELLTLITQHSKYDDVIQCEIIEEITVLDGFGTQLARVGAFAAYYNGPKFSELMERFHCTGQGLALYEELCRLAQEQARRTA